MSEKDFKIVGQIDDADAVGLLGINMATSGDAIAVEGKTESEEGYGFYTEDNTYVGNELEAGAVRTAGVTIEQQIDVDQTPHTIYVRSNGDDSNTGLREDDPVATVSEAVHRVTHVPTTAANGDLPTHVINFESGEVFEFEERILMSWPWVGKVRFETNGPDRAVLEAPGVGRAMRFKNCRVDFKGITLRNRDDSNRPRMMLSIEEGCYFDLRDSLITGAFDRQVRVDKASYFDQHSDATVRGLGKNSSTRGVAPHGGSFAIIKGTIENAGRGIGGTRNGSWAIEAGGIIENCGVAMHAGDEAVGKLRDSTIRNCNVAYRIRHGGHLKHGPGSTLENTKQTVEHIGLGTFRDEVHDRTIIYGWESSGIGTVAVPGGGKAQTAISDSPDSSKPFTINYYIQDPPENSDVAIDLKRWRWDSDNGVMRAEIVEELGFVEEVDVAYQIWEYAAYGCLECGETSS